MKQKGQAGSTSNTEGLGLEGQPPEEQNKILLRRLRDVERERTLFAEKAGTADKLKKDNLILEKKLERLGGVLRKTEESKGKLEELCRELQKYNKELREDSIRKVKGMEQERAKSVQELKQSLRHIEQTMQEGHGKSESLAADNARLAQNLAALAKEYEEKTNAIAHQYETKEKYWQELNNTKDAEINLLKARAEALKINVQKQSLEKEELTRSLLEGTARVGGAIENERVLRDQVKEYAEKYASLHKSISASNESFDRFKKEIDRVNSKLHKVETDASKWKVKYEESNKVVLVLTMQKKEQEEQLAKMQKQLDTLSSLCRTLSKKKEDETTAADDTQ